MSFNVPTSTDYSVLSKNITAIALNNYSRSLCYTKKNQTHT